MNIQAKARQIAILMDCEECKDETFFIHLENALNDRNLCLRGIQHYSSGIRTLVPMLDFTLLIKNRS